VAERIRSGHVSVINVNDVHLYYERIGSGEPLILLHGSWSDHSVWDLVTPLLEGRFDVVAYDRRGHSESEGRDSPGSFDEDADDLATLVEALKLAPAHVIANSSGGLITMKAVSNRPELFGRISLHEPPGLGLLAGDPEGASLLEQTGPKVAAVASKIAAAENEAAASQFVNEVAIGPGIWDQLPAEARAMMVRNAPTFLDEASDPRSFEVDRDAVSSLERPILLTQGSEGPPFYGKVLDELESLLPNVERRTITGAGHMPMATHPEQYADVVSEFLLET
jgi:pimeloyl-ACP methyl ester carboxylesterase